MGVMSLLQTSFTSMFPMLSITTSGAILSYMKLLNKSKNSLLTIAAFNFFGPILNFVYISSSLDLKDLETIWPLIAIPLLMNVILIFTSHFLVRFIGFPETMRNTFTVFFAISNYGLVYTLAEGVCSPYGPMRGYEYCSETFSYISIYHLSQIFVYWTVGYTVVGLDRRNLINQLDGEILESPTLKNNTLCHNISTNLKNPNVISCVLGLIFAILPGYKSILFYSDSPLISLASVSKELGFLCIFLSQIVLGSNIYMMTGTSSRLTHKQIFFSVLLKTVIIPFISLVVVYSFWIIGVFGENRLMAYVIFMSHSCPPAIISMAFAIMYKMNLDEVVQNMFWVCIVSIFTIACWTFIFFILT